MPESNKMQKAALVTGGAVRLGKAIAITLASHGLDIALHFYSSKQEAEKTAAEVRERGVRCDVFQFDLMQAHAIPDFMRSIKAVFPQLEVLVNSASGYQQAGILTTEIATFDTQLAINLRAPFFLTKAFAEQCGRGNIINILDNKIAFNQYQYAAYLLSKKAFAEFTKMAAVELAPDIRVNGVAPGVILPAATRAEEYIAWRIEGIPLKKQGHAQDIGQSIIHLIENPFITGQIIFIDGGESLTNTGRSAGDFDPGKV